MVPVLKNRISNKIQEFSIVIAIPAGMKSLDHTFSVVHFQDHTIFPGSKAAMLSLVVKSLIDSKTVLSFLGPVHI